MLAGLFAKYQASKEAVLRYGVGAKGPGCASFTAPVGITIEESWRAFCNDLNLGPGNEQLGFSKETSPKWFPKNPGDTVVIGEGAVRVEGSEQLSRDAQAQLFKDLNLRLASIFELVEAHVAEKLVEAVQTVVTFETLQNTAEWMNMHMLSMEVLHAVIEQEQARRSPEPLSVKSSWSSNLTLPHADDDQVAIAVAVRRPPE